MKETMNTLIKHPETWGNSLKLLTSDAALLRRCTFMVLLHGRNIVDKFYEAKSTEVRSPILHYGILHGLLSWQH